MSDRPPGPADDAKRQSKPDAGETSASTATKAERPSERKPAERPSARTLLGLDSEPEGVAPESSGSERSLGDRSDKRHSLPRGAVGRSRLSRANRRRLAIYPSLLLAITFGLFYCTSMPGKSFAGPFAPTPEETAMATELRSDVRALSGNIGARNVEIKDTLAQAERFVTVRFGELGYVPNRLSYDVGLRSVANVEVTVKGGARAREIVVIGAHYDSAYDAPGADDNASGVAGLLALAKSFAKKTPERTLRFVAFANEEPPRFWTEQMGSLVYAKACRERNDEIVAMLSLESIGYYRDEPGTQKYPPPMSFFYSDRAGFVGFVGNTSSRSLTRNVVQMFRGAVDFPSEGAALPAFIAGVGWSDQWSFWQVGYPGVMVTDTAPFRNPNYHKTSDGPETLDYERLARVVRGLEVVVKGLSISP